MIDWLWEIFDDPAATEARFLAQLLRQAPELPEWSAAVQPVLTRLLTCNRIQRPMFSRVLTLNMFNAMALPHATIVLAESLVEFCRGQTDQLAFVLAHEAAHINLGHAKDRQRAKALAAVLRINPLIGFGIKLLFERAFSREQEFEADKAAAAMCARAGYAPQAATVFLGRLGAFAGSSSSVGQWLSTHPPTTERIAELHSFIK